MAWTSRLVSSRAAMAVDVVNELAPRCKPRTIRPSFWYCSMGSQNKSRIPWTIKIPNAGEIQNCEHILEDSGLLRYDTVSISKWLPMFWMDFQCFECNMILQNARNTQCQSTTSQKTWTLSNTAVRNPKSCKYILRYNCLHTCSLVYVSVSSWNGPALTELHYSMHWSNAAQQTLQLVLLDILQPLIHDEI